MTSPSASDASRLAAITRQSASESGESSASECVMFGLSRQATTLSRSESSSAKQRPREVKKERSSAKPGRRRASSRAFSPRSQASASCGTSDDPRDEDSTRQSFGSRNRRCSSSRMSSNARCRNASLCVSSGIQRMCWTPLISTRVPPSMLTLTSSRAAPIPVLTRPVERARYRR